MASISWSDDNTKATIEVTPRELFVIRNALRKRAYRDDSSPSQSQQAKNILDVLEGE